MRYRVLVSAVVAVALQAGASPILAGHVEPSKAQKFHAPLVNSFFRCDTPNTATQASGTGACAPAAPNDLCAFSSSGTGKLTIAVTGDPTKGTQVFKVNVTAKGLNDLCENRELCVFLAFRATTDDCPEGACITFDRSSSARSWSGIRRTAALRSGPLWYRAHV